jgi:hypothetical protein
LAESRKGGGSKLFRTELVSVRIDPKLRFAVELAARKQRRTSSSFVEWAIEEAVKRLPLRISAIKRKVGVPEEASIPEELPIGVCLEYLQQLSLGKWDIKKKTVHAIVGEVWHPEESRRFAQLATRYPELLTHDEEVLWDLISETPELWRSDKHGQRIIIYTQLKARWEQLKQAAIGELGKTSTQRGRRGK